MRLVLDTNVVISALLWEGTPAVLLDYARLDEIELFTSPSLLAELNNILTRTKFAKAIAATQLPAMELALGYTELANVIKPDDIAPTILVDPADDQVLACAIAAKADLIVSGDRHLHSPGGAYQGITIVRPSEAIQIIAAG